MNRRDDDGLENLEATLVEVEQVPKVQKIEHRFNRRSQVVVIISLLVALLSASWTSYIAVRQASNTAQQVVNEQDIKDLREANKLREEAGLKPIPLPKPGQDIDSQALARAAAAIALDSIQNDPRFTGPQGQRGEPCVPAIPGCTGPMGPGGQTGSQGPGPSDSDIAGAVAAYCSQVSQPCSGDQGPQGDPGVQGPSGPPGPPVPAFAFDFTVPGDGLSIPDRHYSVTCSAMGNNYECVTTEG